MKQQPQDAVVCALCRMPARDRDFRPSGHRNRHTLTTPADNFVCRRCQREVREARLVGAALVRYAARAAI